MWPRTAAVFVADSDTGRTYTIMIDALWACFASQSFKTIWLLYRASLIVGSIIPMNTHVVSKISGRCWVPHHNLVTASRILSVATSSAEPLEGMDVRRPSLSPTHHAAHDSYPFTLFRLVPPSGIHPEHGPNILPCCHPSRHPLSVRTCMVQERS